MLTREQEQEGYRLEASGEYVLVWHHNNQIALLRATADIAKRVQELVERHRQELKAAAGP